MPLRNISRRKFLISCATTIAGMSIDTHSAYAATSTFQPRIDDFMNAEMGAHHIPGLAAAIIKNGKIAWSKGYGWANIKQQLAMSPLETVQNIASVSKTVTATAVMQLWEQNKFQLDDDINAYLPFTVRNPSYPDEPITFQQLLTHRSSIKDGSAYGKSYTCGDPTVSLESWLREYFTPGGTFYDRAENFHLWRPGEQKFVPRHPRNYSNVGFGVLGYLVETLSGKTFSSYCRDNIFAPLDLENTAWYLTEMDISKHAVPYRYVADGEIGGKLLRQGGSIEGNLQQGGYLPHCLYSFTNYPDGLLRTSVNQLARFLMVYMNQGSYGKNRILQESTITQMLRLHVDSDKHQGLCWISRQLDTGELVWGHNGSDPGVGASMFFRPADRVGVIVFMNTSGVDLEDIVSRLFQESTRF
jgi:CubicO group peptidase (beta-lactamase class C family)